MRLLAIFHFVGAGLALLSLLFLFLQHTMFDTVFNNPEMWTQGGGQPPPEAFRKIFEQVLFWFFLAFGLFSFLQCVLDLLCGWFLLKRRHRTFCLIVGGLDCLNVPLGTILGVFTLMVLNRDSVRPLFEPKDGTP